MPHRTAREIMGIVVVIPRGYKPPTDQKLADRDRAKFIFEQHPDVMRSRSFATPEELLRKYWDDPDGLLENN
jgi:hypothetical protein